ncbi:MULTISPECIES: DUF7266 family protein [Halorubrum]|uniref:Uncharacterized protein n=1 Tax=Halorubrum sodomense TaxID=35743 RepID=A0A1I6H6T9_HALSD|nr:MULTISPECIES: hypothetical protein [Halorubrum]TKX55749.1 hypothetical protein EXE42_01765 [Halorubrum sp. SP3]TKX71467.1 hypothetical protein EXE45_00925 [Halorubrum sp. SP9]SFR50213.1 hypothetical protein SAMN04487937_2514 [Halorubrum sodomense]
MRDGSEGSDRAVSVTVGYVMTLAISTLLLSGLFVAGGSFVETQRERAAQGELTVVGERIAADVGTVDRLAASASSREELTVNRSLTLPNRAAGTGYRIRVTASGTEGTIALESGQTDASVAVPFRTSEGVAVRNVTVDGGDLLIFWDPDAGPNGSVVVSER